MARDRVYVSDSFKKTTDELKNQDVLGLSMAEGKEVFMLSVALGLDNPTLLKNRQGLFLNTALKTADKALIASVLLGTMSDDEDMDQHADFDKSCELCEKCAENGIPSFAKKKKKYNDAGCDEELLERRLLLERDLLYSKNVLDDLT